MKDTGSPVAYVLTIKKLDLWKQMANKGEKTGVGIAQWAAYHSERNFRDAFKFAPERWMGDPAYKDDLRDVVQGFSFGPRNCLGRRYVTSAISFPGTHSCE